MRDSRCEVCGCSTFGRWIEMGPKRCEPCAARVALRAAQALATWGDIRFDERIRRQLATLGDLLPYRERRILELRYGFDGERPRTLDEVAGTFNVTRSRVDSLQRRAMAKLEHAFALHTERDRA